MEVGERSEGVESRKYHSSSIAASKKCARACTLKIEGHKFKVRIIDKYSHKYSLNKKEPANQAINYNQSSNQASKQAGRQAAKQAQIASKLNKTKNVYGLYLGSPCDPFMYCKSTYFRPVSNECNQLYVCFQRRTFTMAPSAYQRWL